MSGAVTEEDVAALNQAQHADPFSVLGLHEGSGGRLEVRALLPRALAVRVVDAAQGNVLAELSRVDGDVFRGVIARRRNRFPYELSVTWTTARTVCRRIPIRSGR